MGQKLTAHLMKHHDKNTPPDGLLQIEYEIELVHIMGIDELRQTLTALVYVDEVVSFRVFLLNVTLFNCFDVEK